MPTLIELHAGLGWYTDDDLDTVQSKLDAGEHITVWWFSPWGQRFTEQALIQPEAVAYIRTESDDG